MATKEETIHFLNKELKALSIAKGGSVRAEQSTYNTATANKIESRAQKTIKAKKIV
jgi:hypothetical protein